MGTSYRLPVRLSVIVSVSAHRGPSRSRLLIVVVAGGRAVSTGMPILAAEPASQVRQLAPLAAERPPRRVHRPLTAIDAEGSSQGKPSYLIEFGDLVIW